jgi:hypothetical protein
MPMKEFSQLPRGNVAPNTTQESVHVFAGGGCADFGKPSCFPLGPLVEGEAPIRLFRARSARICPPSASSNRWLIDDGLLVVLNPEMMMLVWRSFRQCSVVAVDSCLVRCCLSRVGRSLSLSCRALYMATPGPHNSAVRRTPANHAGSVPWGHSTNPEQLNVEKEWMAAERTT